MAERSNRRVRGAVTCLVLASMVALAVPSAANANTRHRGDRRHDVLVTSYTGTTTKVARHVRADDLTSLRATYRPRRLIATMGMVARDHYSNENYTMVFTGKRSTLLAFVFASPIDPKGTVFTVRLKRHVAVSMSPRRVARLAHIAKAEKAHACGRTHHRLSAHAVRFEVPARCLDFAERVSINGSAMRDAHRKSFEDDVHRVRVRRG